MCRKKHTLTCFTLNTPKPVRRKQERYEIIMSDTEKITGALEQLFAPEDAALQQALVAAKEAGLPEIQISPLQGKLLQVLAAACNAQKILEIGALAGYSGIWLARSLPAHGTFITLEVSAKHAEVVRQSLDRAQITARTKVRVGAALDLLPTLQDEAPFDLIFIDADKPSYPQYLDWALKLSRPGSIIVADNCIRNGQALVEPAAGDTGSTAALYTYNKQTATHPRLRSISLPMSDGNHTDGYNISVVLPEA
jgi:caffeoyl-CoA O-methyltransferase